MSVGLIGTLFGPKLSIPRWFLVFFSNPLIHPRLAFVSVSHGILCHGIRLRMQAKLVCGIHEAYSYDRHLVRSISKEPGKQAFGDLLKSF